MDTEIITLVLVFFSAVFSNLGQAGALTCWQCIADNCDKDPSENYKATQKLCSPGGFCQKVIYTDRYNNTTNPISIVRSCSSRCVPKDNYFNCTLSKRGCVRRHCCQDADLCNRVPQTSLPWNFVLIALVIFCAGVISDFLIVRT